jgi:hypothetical protein
MQVELTSIDEPQYQKYVRFSSLFPTLHHEIIAYGTFLNIEHSPEGFFSSAYVLWPEWVRYVFDRQNTQITRACLDLFERTVGPMLPTTWEAEMPDVPGRFSWSLEVKGGSLP